MSAFLYFDYHGTLPPTVYSAIQEPYRYIVEVAKSDSDGHEKLFQGVCPKCGAIGSTNTQYLAWQLFDLLKSVYNSELIVIRIGNPIA
jgi:hypothetical protein